MRKLLFLIIAFALCNFANISAQEVAVVQDTFPKNPCYKPTSCPDKKYAYRFNCYINNVGQIIQNDFIYDTCISNPFSNYQNGEYNIPTRLNLPLCAEFDKDTLYNTDNPNEKLYDTFCLYPKHKKVVAINDTTIVKDTVCIFDVKKINCDLAEVLHEWNCLCDKENEPCECKIKIRFSNRQKDFGGYPMNEILGLCLTNKAGINRTDSCRLRCPTSTGIFINFGKGVTERSDTVNIFYYNGESSDTAMQSKLQKLRNGVGGQTKGVSLRDLLLHELGHALNFGHYYQRDSLGNKRLYSSCDTTDDGIMRGGGGVGNGNREGLSQDDKCKFMKLYCQSGITDVKYSSNADTKNKLIAYPNPLNTTLNLEFTLMKSQRIVLFMIDVTGKKIEADYVQELSAGNHKLIVNTNNYPNGKYFSTLQHDGITETISFVIQK